MDLSIVVDWAIQGFKKLSGSTILSIISIFIALTVFRFNQKMGYSKLSVLPLFTVEDHFADLSSPEYTYFSKELSYFKRVKGLPTDVFDITYGDSEEEKKRGQALLSYFDSVFHPRTLTVKLRNKGELASTNIKIVLLFKGYGSSIKYSKNPIDVLDYKSHKRKLFSRKKIVMQVPYMGADEEKDFMIVDLNGQFREAELILCKVRANGHTYFKEKLLDKMFNRVVINHYIHPYIGHAADSSDINTVLGIGNDDEQWVDPYKRKGWIKWLQNLYAEWRK